MLWGPAPFAVVDGPVEHSETLLVVPGSRKTNAQVAQHAALGVAVEARQYRGERQ